MHVFFLTEAFTIIEAVNYIIENEITEADAYVIKVTSSSEQWAEKLRETKLFKNVYLWNQVLLAYPITFRKCVDVVLNGKKLVKFMKDKRYDFAYYNNGGWLVNSIFYSGVVQNNPNAKHIYLEHVSLTYTTAYHEKSRWLAFFIKLFGFKLLSGPQLTSFKVYKPELVQVEQCVPVEKMAKIDRNNPHVVEILNGIFDYDRENDDFKDKEIIIMEQPPYKEKYDIEAFWQPVLDIIDTERTILKAHPRQKECALKDKGINISRNHTIPWEINILNNNISNKVQITIFSSSCTSPKVMFDEEPIIILLYKLLPFDYSFLGEKLLDFTDAVAKNYQDPTRFFVPNSIDELKEYCIKMGLAKE